MSPFEEMAVAFRGHVKMWKAPPACKGGKGRYAILVCNWVSTSVPFFSAEIAFALRHEGCEVVVLWDPARVGVAAPSEAETKIIGDTVRALPRWLGVVDVDGPAPALPAPLASTIDKIFQDNAIWFAKGEVPATELLKNKSAEREDFSKARCGRAEVSAIVWCGQADHSGGYFRAERHLFGMRSAYGPSVYDLRHGFGIHHGVP